MARKKTAAVKVDSVRHKDKRRNIPTEDDLDQRLLSAGVISHVPTPLTDLAPYRRWKPITARGNPLSETIIEERR